MNKFESDQVWLAIRCEPNVSRTLSEELLSFANACEKIGMEKAAKISDAETEKHDEFCTCSTAIRKVI